MSTEHETRPMEPDDLFRLRFLLDGRLSPDGQAAAYVVGTTEGEKGKEKDCSAIWLVSLETGKSRQLTAGLSTDAAPRWSPDGRTMAFVSKRGDKAQIYTIPVDGGEARPLTALPQGVGSSLAWSPDGTRLAFTAPPQTMPRDPAMPYRVTRHVYRFDVVGYLDDVVQSVYVINVGSGEPERLSSDGWQAAEVQWSPDGSEILYLATLRPDSHRFRAGLKAVNLQGDTRVIVDDWGQVACAAWLPSGHGVAFAGVPGSAPAGTQNKIWTLHDGGEPVCRTPSIDRQVAGGFQADMRSFRTWTPRLFVSATADDAYVQVQCGGVMPVYRVALRGNESAQPAIEGDRVNVLFDARGGRILFGSTTTNQPPDLHVASEDGTDEVPLTSLNATFLKGLSLPATERLLFAGGDGAEVEGWLMRPVSGDPPYPTILYIHGGPHTAYGNHFHFDFHMLAAAGYAVLFINHRASTGYGDAFATAIKGDWGHLDYGDLMAGLDLAIARGLVDGQRLGCCGLSGGGNLSCWIVGQTRRFKAAVPENPVTNWVSFYGVSDIGPWFSVEELGGLPHEIPDVYRRCSPITYAHRCTTPTLMIQGESDHRCPPEQSEQFYSVLKANGCTVEMLRLPSSPHGGSIGGPPAIRRAQNEALLGWMNRYVLGREPQPAEDGWHSG